MTGSRSEAYGVLPTQWENGFEALGSLDTDRDGELRGSELDPLALWFDRDRDGVAQPGEVTSIVEAGGYRALLLHGLSRPGDRKHLRASRLRANHR